MSEEAEEGSQLPIKGQGCCRRGGGKGTIRLKGEKELEGGEGASLRRGRRRHRCRDVINGRGRGGSVHLSSL